jgi:hypothetical protein
MARWTRNADTASAAWLLVHSTPSRAHGAEAPSVGLKTASIVRVLSCLYRFY